MALVKCKECGKEISDKAEVCIHCGVEQKAKKEEVLFSINQSPKKQSYISWFITRNIISFMLIIFGAVVIINGQQTYSYIEPSRYILSPEKYVGGDAYNYIMEASLKGGEISGTRAANATFNATEAIYYCTGYIIISLGLFKLKVERR